MNKKIAKSNGLSLVNHSKIVEKYGLILLGKIVDDNSPINRFNDIIKYSCILHDIGKLTTNFQKFINGDKKSPGYKFRHNEIGWAFLSKYLSEDLVDLESREIILNIVYWHHGISNKLNKHTDVEILSTLDADSINNMLEYLTDQFGEGAVNNYIDNTPYKSPSFFPDDKPLKKSTPKLNLLRSIVITADRNASEFTDINQVTNDLVDKYLEMDCTINVGKTKFDGTERFNLQKEIVEKIIPNRTVLVKAPAGFGKTLVGVLWGFKTKQKVIWVVPRNTIAKSLYKSIVNEFDNINVSTSIQLVLGGEVVETNDTNINMYEANIIVTNIDNYLAPNIKNNLMDSSGLLFGAKVIFDEYHELVTSAPLMALFIDIMKVRNNIASSSTLLLSATPVDCDNLWDMGKLNPNKDTIVLPNRETHYPAAHTKKYLINVSTEWVSPEPDTNALTIFNTIRGSQIEMLNNDYNFLIHSNFTEDYKIEKLNTLLTKYGKSAITTDTKPNVVGTHMIQASLDISLSKLYETVLSPQATLQRIGRINRWGELEMATINIIKDTNNDLNRSNNCVIGILYNRNLSDCWFDYLTEYDGQYLTLDELYVIYNKFSIEYSEAIAKFVNDVYNTSSTYLSTLYPYKFNNTDKSNKVMTAGSNKLRSVNNEIFYIVKHKDKDEWVGPFTITLYNSPDIEFNEEGNTYTRMKQTMKILRNNNDERFEYNDLLDKEKYGGTIDRLRVAAKKANTPYIVYDRVYCDKLGILKN
jgi:CRISPR-associated endonuclease/helicase Cas3